MAFNLAQTLLNFGHYMLGIMNEQFNNILHFICRETTCIYKG